MQILRARIDLLEIAIDVAMMSRHILSTIS
jgi:hypothetical protein